MCDAFVRHPFIGQHNLRMYQHVTLQTVQTRLESTFANYTTRDFTRRAALTILSEIMKPLLPISRAIACSLPLKVRYHVGDFWECGHDRELGECT